MKSRYDISPKIKGNSNTIKKDYLYDSTPLPDDLIKFIRGRGHPYYQCLDPVYSPSSRIPCVDFTPWIINKLSSGMVIQIKRLFWEIMRGNPGPYNRDYWINKVSKLLSTPLERYIKFDSLHAYNELMSALIIISTQYEFNEKIIDKSSPVWLATIMFPYQFNIDNIKLLLYKERQSILKSTNEYVSLTNLLKNRSNRSNLDLENNEVFQKLQSVLSKVTIGTRSHFFDIIEYYRNNKNINNSIEDMAFYETRRYGIDSNETSKELISNELVLPIKNNKSKLYLLTKEHLLQAITSIDSGPKKSWNKEKIVNYIHDILPHVAEQLTEKIFLVAINPLYTPVIDFALDYISFNAEYYSLFLAYGFS